MGAAASKTGAKQAAAAATRTTTPEAAPHVIRTNLTREDLVAMARRPTRPAAAGGATGMERPGGKIELAEMNEELLRRAERFEDFGRVEYLAVRCCVLLTCVTVAEPRLLIRSCSRRR